MIHDTCGNKINNIDEQTHFFRKIYHLHFIRNGWKGLRKGFVWEVSWRRNKDCNILTPVPPSLAALLSRSAELVNRRPWGPISLLGLVLTASNCNNWLQLTELPVAPGYVIVWHPPASCGRHICTQFNPFTVKVIPWYLRTDAPVPWSAAGSEVNMLHCILVFTQMTHQIIIYRLEFLHFECWSTQINPF